jgi:hypothetical protein
MTFDDMLKAIARDRVNLWCSGGRLRYACPVTPLPADLERGFLPFGTHLYLLVYRAMTLFNHCENMVIWLDGIAPARAWHDTLAAHQAAACRARIELNVGELGRIARDLEVLAVSWGKGGPPAGPIERPILDESEGPAFVGPPIPKENDS